MRRKPSASHWVKKESLLTYRPISWVFLTGAQVVKISSSKGSAPSGRFSSTSWLPSILNEVPAPLTSTRARFSSSPCRRSGCAGHVRVAAQRHLVEHAGLGGVQVERELDRIDPVGRRAVVLATNRDGGALGIMKQHQVSPENWNGRVRCSPARPRSHAARRVRWRCGCCRPPRHACRRAVRPRCQRGRPRRRCSWPQARQCGAPLPERWPAAACRAGLRRRRRWPAVLASMSSCDRVNAML